MKSRISAAILLLMLLASPVAAGPVAFVVKHASMATAKSAKFSSKYTGTTASAKAAAKYVFRILKAL